MSCCNNMSHSNISNIHPSDLSRQNLRIFIKKICLDSFQTSIQIGRQSGTNDKVRIDHNKLEFVFVFFIQFPSRFFCKAFGIKVRVVGERRSLIPILQHKRLDLFLSIVYTLGVKTVPSASGRLITAPPIYQIINSFLIN